MRQVEEFRCRQRRGHHFHHSPFESREAWPIFGKQSHELVDFRFGDRATPDTPEETTQHLAAIELLVIFVVARKENVRVRLGGPLLVKRCADFDIIDQNLKRFIAARIRDVLNVQEFIAPWKRCRELAERVALNIAQRDIESDELRVVSRCRDRDVALADDLREVGVVAGVGTEYQTQARILVRVHVRTPGANANAHDAFVGKKAI